MEKIIAGPGCQGALDLDAPPEDNLKAIAKRLDRDVEDLVVMVLDRPRHEDLIARIRRTVALFRGPRGRIIASLVGQASVTSRFASAHRVSPGSSRMGANPSLQLHALTLVQPAD